MNVESKENNSCARDAVYANSEIYPVSEDHLIDNNSRHIGKAITENWLKEIEIPFTSFRPTYIYGAGNYNPIEKWFFDRILNKQPVPLPSNGNIFTQLGHVSDLANAISKSLNYDIAKNKIYNCSSKKAVTFKGLLEASIKAVGKEVSDIDVKYFDPTNLDPKQRKFFPLRMSHFFTDVSRLESEIEWQESIDLQSGFVDSYNNDYLINKNNILDFSNDSKLIEV